MALVVPRVEEAWDDPLSLLGDPVDPVDPVGPVDPEVLVDLEVLAAMTEGDRELMGDFVEEFLNLLPEQRLALEGALRGEEDQTVYALHRLKGSASYLGARSLETLASELLDLWRSGGQEEARPRLGGLLDLLGRVEARLRDLEAQGRIPTGS